MTNNMLYVFLSFLLMAILITNYLRINELEETLITIIKSEAQKNRAIESEGRCYKLNIPKGFGD